MKRTFEFTDDKSSKFWSIEVKGNEFTVNYGKTGTAGQKQTKSFADEVACTKEANKLIAEKTKKGYVEQTNDTTIQPKVATEAPNIVAVVAKKAHYTLLSKMNNELVAGILKRGRSVKRGEVTAADIKNVVTLCGNDAQAKSMLSNLEGYYDTVIFDGDLCIDGNLSIDDCGVCNLIVFGNLTVNAILEHYDDPATFIFVGGNLYAQNLFTGGALYVNGNTTVDHFLIGDYNDYSAELNGKVTAHFFYPEEHFFTMGKCKFDYSYGNEYRNNAKSKFLTDEQAFELFNPYLFLTDEQLKDEDEVEEYFVENFSHHKIIEAIRIGLPVFRNEPPYSKEQTMPERPANVPADAYWIASGKKWMTGELDKSGNVTGEWKTWLSNGNIAKEVSNVKNRCTVIYYHPDGSIASKYGNILIDNKWNTDGEAIDQRSDNPTPDVTFPMNVPEVWKIVRVFKKGERQSTVFTDRSGLELDYDKVMAAYEAMKQKKTISEEIELDMTPWPERTTGKLIAFNDALKQLPVKYEYEKNDKFNALVIEGDVHVKGNLVLDEYYRYNPLAKINIILVDGSLTVEGTLQLASGERDPALVVKGSLMVKNLIFSETEILVGGDLKAENFIFGMFEGEVLAKGSIKAKYFYGPDNNIESKGKDVREKLNELSNEDFTSDYYDEDDEDLDWDDVIDALCEGKNVVKKQ